MVSPAQKQVYNRRYYWESRLKLAAQELPEGYKSGDNTFTRHFPTYTWSDPGGRFHIVTIGKTGKPHVISMWKEDLRKILGEEHWQIVSFPVDPLLSVWDVQRLVKKKYVSPEWLKDALKRAA